MKKPLFSKVMDADRQCGYIKNTFGQICVDAVQIGRNNEGGRAPGASPGYSLVLQGTVDEANRNTTH